MRETLQNLMVGIVVCVVRNSKENSVLSNARKVKMTGTFIVQLVLHCNFTGLGSASVIDLINPAFSAGPNHRRLF